MIPRSNFQAAKFLESHLGLEYEPQDLSLAVRDDLGFDVHYGPTNTKFYVGVGSSATENVWVMVSRSKAAEMSPTYEINQDGYHILGFEAQGEK